MVIDLSKAKSIDDYPYSSKVLIYGMYGSGKTQFASTFPNPFWIDFEKSTDTLSKIGLGNIKGLRPKSMKEVEEHIEALCKDSSPYDTIVIDTANSLQMFQMREYMLKVVGDKRDQDMPAQMDYRKSTNQLSRIFSDLQSCNKNVVILCQQRIVTEKRDDGTYRIVGYKPDLTERLAELVGAVISNVFYLEKTPGIGSTSGPKWKMFINPSNTYKVVKNRLGRQEQFIENPTYHNIFGAI